MLARNINLIAEKDFDTSPVGRFLRWALSYGRFIIISTEIIVLMAFIFRFSLDRTITDLNEAVEQKSAIVQANLGFEDRFRNLQTRTIHIDEIMVTQNPIIPVLEHLQKITPSGIRLSTLKLDKQILIISAKSSSNANLTVFVQNLKDSQQIQNVNITTLNKSNPTTGEIVFQLEATVVNQTNL